MEQLMPGGHGSAAPVIRWVRSPLLGSTITCGRSRARRCSTLCSTVGVAPAPCSGNLLSQFAIRTCARQSTRQCQVAACVADRSSAAGRGTHAVLVVHGRRVDSHRRHIPVRPVPAECMPTKCSTVHERRRRARPVHRMYQTTTCLLSGSHRKSHNVISLPALPCLVDCFAEACLVGSRPGLFWCSV
jgi:hypothetical protein